MRKMLNVLALVGCAAAMSACGDTAKVGDADDKALLQQRAQASLQDFYNKEPAIRDKAMAAHAYAIFPRIVTAAVGVGGAGGDGVVYKQGQIIGYADMNQASIGAQLGGQKYAELILFQSETPLINFQNGTWAVDAKASAVAAGAGAAATADYSNGVMVFTLPEGGLMAQAAIGGQKFRYKPVMK